MGEVSRQGAQNAATTLVMVIDGIDFKCFKSLGLRNDDVRSEGYMTTYSIRDAARHSGLPASTLRYYESVGIVEPINRDTSSGHRVYTDEDLEVLEAVSCLNATGLSLEEMRLYLQNRTRGAEGAQDQIRLLAAQRDRLEAERIYLELRHSYVTLKIKFWEALERQDAAEVQRIAAEAATLAHDLKFTRPSQMIPLKDQEQAWAPK